jgi:hypothetical protein
VSSRVALISERLAAKEQKSNNPCRDFRMAHALSKARFSGKKPIVQNP